MIKILNALYLKYLRKIFVYTYTHVDTWREKKRKGKGEERMGQGRGKERGSRRGLAENGSETALQAEQVYRCTCNF